jgi:hypothetical protein
MIRLVHSRWPILLLVVVLLLMPHPARAQERGFASGLGAVTFGTVTGTDIAGRVGAAPSRHVMIFGELGRMTDALPKTDQQTITDNASALAASEGGIATVLGHVPVVYGTGGVRINGTTRNRVTPFAEAAFGFAHVTNTLSVTVSGTDVSPQVLTTPLTSRPSQTDPLMSLGGGVSFAAGTRTAIDIGYRYSRIFATDQGINTGKLYGGVRVGF